MAFMDPQITAKQYWILADGDCGLDAIPADLIDLTKFRKLIADENPDCQSEARSMIRNYTENSDIREIEIRFGYGVRLSASGYMDCTPWEVFTNKREAISRARELARGD